MNLEKHIEEIRADFPIFNRKINGNRLVYFDNAASSQKPKQVLETIIDTYENHYANVHRGLHELSEEATLLYDEARINIAKFINCESSELVFTSNSTHSINLVAYTFLHRLKRGDKIVVSIMEHHSNLVPWQYLAPKFGLKLEYLYIDDSGCIPDSEYEKLYNANLLAITHVSNVLGVKNDVKTMAKILHEHNGYVLVDGSQSTPHFKIDVKSLDCDFFAFTGHKMLGPTGIGALYIKKDILLEPFFFGGDMIKDVSEKEAIFQKPPQRYEAGTPNFVGAIALSKAVDYLNKIGMSNIEVYEKKLNQYFLSNIPDFVNLLGPYKDRENVFSFTIKGINASDIAMFLNKYGIAIRSGMHCAHPLHKFLKISGSARASLYFYNTFEEIDYFFRILNKLKG